MAPWKLSCCPLFLIPISSSFYTAWICWLWADLGMRKASGQANRRKHRQDFSSLVAAVIITNWVAWTNMNLLSYSSRSQQSRMDLTGLKSSGQSSVEFLWGKSISSPFLVSGGCKDSLTQGSFFHLQRSTVQSSIFAWLWSSCLLHSLMRTLWHIGPAQVIQGNLPISRSAD